MDRIDWTQPWLHGWRAPGERVAAQVAAGMRLHAALNTERVAPASPIRFVPQSELPADQAYEDYIFRTGQCPTRDNLHDFFNGLCWLRFPRTKKKLNQLQAGYIQAQGISPVRGPVRDALTVFDENAALLAAPEPLWDALARKDWPLLFKELRPLWAQAQLVLFGHALLEKLAQPRKAITAHVYRVPDGMACHTDLDAWLAADLRAGKLATKPFAPLPVLGVPGWWAGNENFSFYDDSLVFRSGNGQARQLKAGRSSGKGRA